MRGTILSRDGAELDDFGGGEEPRHRREEVLRRMHHGEEMATSEMAGELGVSKTTIHDQMNRHGIERLGHRPEDESAGPPDEHDERSVPDPGSPDAPFVCPDCGRGHSSMADQHDCMRSHARAAADAFGWSR